MSQINIRTLEANNLMSFLIGCCNSLLHTNAVIYGDFIKKITNSSYWFDKF